MKANRPWVWCAAVLLLAGKLWGQSGGEFSPPYFSFDHINRDGTLHFSDVWVDLDAGDGWKLPLAANFDNARKERSPYLDKGWRIGLFESQVTEVDEKTLSVLMPGGIKLRFKRKAPELYEGDQGWMGRGTADDFIITPSCGDEFITFEKGRVKSMGFGKRTFEFVRDGRGMVAALVDQKTRESIIECQFNSSGSLELLKVSGGEEISIEQSPAPEAEDTAKAPPARTRVSFKKRKTFTECHSYVKKEGAVAGLKIKSKRGLLKNFQWDVKSKKILDDGRWSYQIEQIGTDFAQTRTDRDGLRQYWFDNRTEGCETLSGFSNSPKGTIRTFYHTKGALFGHTYRVEEERDGKWSVVQTFSYDDQGRVTGERNHKAGTDIRTEFGEKGITTRRFHDLSGKLLKSIRLNEKSQPVEMEIAGSGEIAAYTYGPDGVFKTRTVTSRSPPETEKPEATPQVLKHGLRYVAEGENAYPPESLPLIAEPGSDPRNFGTRFLTKYDSLGTKSRVEAEEWDGFNTSMGRFLGGSDGKTHYSLIDTRKHLTVSLDGASAGERIYRLFWRREFVTLPLAMFMESGGDDPLMPSWRDGSDIAEAFDSVSAEAQKHAGESEFTIARKFKGATWRAAFAVGNVYPKELIIEAEGAPFLKWQVTKWGENIGPITFPREIETALYIKGAVYRNVKLTIQSIGPSEASSFAVPYDQAIEINDLDTGAFFATGKAR